MLLCAEIQILVVTVRLKKKKQFPTQKFRGVDLQTACYFIYHGKYNFYLYTLISLKREGGVCITLSPILFL